MEKKVEAGKETWEKIEHMIKWGGQDRPHWDSEESSTFKGSKGVNGDNIWEIRPPRAVSEDPVMECAYSVPGEAESMEKGGDKEKPCWKADTVSLVGHWRSDSYWMKSELLKGFDRESGS